MSIINDIFGGGDDFTPAPDGTVDGSTASAYYKDPASGQMYQQGINGEWFTKSLNGSIQPSNAPPPSAIQMSVGPDGTISQPNINPLTGQPIQVGAPGQLGYGFGTSPLQAAMGIDKLASQDKDIVNGAVNQGQANLNAAAAATTGAGRTMLGNGYSQQAYQQGQGAQGVQQGQQLADYNTMLGQQAAGGMQALGQQANDASGFYGGQGVQQMANAGQDRATQLQQVAALQKYYQQGPGPSAAQAQLQQANNQTQANALSLANSGRGAGDAAQAQRQAMFVNAATQQTTNQQMAQLRAQEEATWRGQQLQGMGMAQGTVGNMQGADIGAANAAGGLGAQYADIAKGYYGQGGQLQQGYAGQANQALGTGQGYNAQMTGNANTAAGQGVSAYDSLAGQGNDLTKTSVGVGLQGAGLDTSIDQAAEAGKTNLMQGAQANDTQRYGIDKGVAIQQQQIDNGKTGALISGAATLGAGLLMASDVRMKRDIVPVVNHFRHTVVKPMDRMQSIARLSDGR